MRSLIFTASAIFSPFSQRTAANSTWEMGSLVAFTGGRVLMIRLSVLWLTGHLAHLGT